MKKDNFTPGEIRELLDLSRSALRYYIRKGLIDVEKNDENGYHSFSQNNLSALRDISYLRQMLDFSITDIQDCFNAASPDEYEAIFIKKKTLLESEIAQKTIQRDRLAEWENYLRHIKQSPDTINIVEFPSPFVFTPTAAPSLDKLSLLCSSFRLEEGAAVFNGYGYCHDDPGENERESVNITYRFPGGKYIYAMCSSDRDMDDPELLTPALNWAKEHNYEVKGPIQVDYFFRIKKDEKYRYFYAITIPFADCDIQVVQ